MTEDSAPNTLVVNFNAPELNQLALDLARRHCLTGYVRPYINKDRWWERGLSALPLAGDLYARTFGRRRIADPALAKLTHEAGIAADLCAAAVLRLPLLSAARRAARASALYMSVRESVARAAVDFVAQADCVVAYEGYALPAFEALRAHRAGRAVLNYPVAHHRHRRRARLEEIEREPDFASTWPDFDDWPEGHEARLDEEIALADAVLVGSSYAAHSFVAEGVPAARMRVVPYGVDLQTFHPPAASDAAAAAATVKPRFQVIYAGQLTQRKGLSYLLRGYQAFARANTDLVLVGSPVGSTVPLQAFAHLFRHVAHQTRSDLAALYRASDVFLFPTLVEGMPLVVLEAMACGLPVIVTANGPADIVRDGVDGFIVPERDPQAICLRLDRLYRDPELRARMGRNAAERAREFGWSAYTGKLRRGLADLCA